MAAYIPKGLEVKGTLGGLPVAEQTQDYFLVFQQVGSASPEILNNSAYFITYLVKSDGTVSKPSEDNDALINLLQNFPINQSVGVRLDQGTALNSDLGGIKKVTAIGEQQNILFTQTGTSLTSYNTGSLTFDINYNTGPEGYPDFRGSAQGGFYIVDDDPERLKITQVINAPSSSVASFNTANVGIFSNSYRLDTNDVNGHTNQLTSLTFKLTATLNNNTTDTQTMGWGLFKEYDSTESALETKTIDIPPLAEGFVTEIERTVFRGEMYPIKESPEGDVGFFGFMFQPPTQFSVDVTNFTLEVIDQNPTYDVPTLTAESPLWLTGSEGSGSNESRWLTASNFISSNYRKTQNYDAISPYFETSFEPSPNVAFDLKIGDRIRFEYNDEQDYHIYDIIPPELDESGSLKIKINKFISPDVNLDNFIIHRVNSDSPSLIILDTNKNVIAGETQNFSGIILPQYPSPQLKDNIDNIIINLKERGIIVDNLN